MNDMTCRDWLGYSPESQNLVRFWMSGYYNAAANSNVLDSAEEFCKGYGVLQGAQVRHATDGDQK
jgi:hypothetical protein